MLGVAVHLEEETLDAGLPPNRMESGLSNLRHRAELAGGRMTTEPGPNGRGLVLTSLVPVPTR
jgi:signal transduction histidine kinase